MNIDSIQEKINVLKNGKNTMYTGVEFERRLKEILQKLGNLDKEIDDEMGKFD